MIALLVASQIMLLASVSAGQVAPLPKLVRGWMIHGATREYHQRVLAAAKRYKINHLEISGDNPTFSEEMALPKGDLCAETAKLARAQGIDPYIWIRELSIKTTEVELDPSTEAGGAFWIKRKIALRAALEKAPDLAGVIMSYASTPTEVWSVKQNSTFWNNMSMAERLRFANDQFKSVVVGEKHKRMYVRDFNHSPQQLKWLVEAFKDYPDVIMHSKWEPQDWQLFYPHSFSIGAYGSVPQVIEADLGAEYWGRSMVPVSMVRYIKMRWDYDREHGCRGVVARIDRDDETCLGTPSEINLFALMRYMDDPKATPEKIYVDWNLERYGLKPNSKASNTMTAIYERGFEQAKNQYFTLGFWTPKDQTMIPSSVRSIEGGVRGKSSALWDPSQKELETQLSNPDGAILKKILMERDLAIQISEKNLTDFIAIKGSLKKADSEDWEARLKLANRFALVWRSMADAVWSVRVAETLAKSAPTNRDGLDAIKIKAEAFGTLAQTLIGSGAGSALRTEMAKDALALQADILKRLATLASN